MLAINRKGVLLALVPLGLAIAMWWIRPHIAFDTDSPRYLEWSPMRTAAYPLFLRLANGPALLPIQLFMFAATLSWLAIYSSRLLPWLVAAGLVLAIAANPFLWQLQGTVLSEALTTPLLTLLVGCTVGFALTQRRSLVIASGLIAGLATSARPSLLPIIVAPLLLAWIVPKLSGRWTLSALILVTFAAPLAAERICSHLVHGAALTSPMGRQLFMKAAMIDAPPTAPVSSAPFDVELARELNSGYAPVRRLIENVGDRNVRDVLLTNYEACAGNGCFLADWTRFTRDEAEIHRHLTRAGLARLASNPFGYLELVASEYRRMWLLHPRKAPAIAPKYNAFLTRASPLPFQHILGEEGRPTPTSDQKQLYALNRAAFAAIGILAALLTLALAVWRRSRLGKAALALLVATQAVLLFSAFFGAAVLRYGMGVWPTLIAGELLGALALLERWKPTFLNFGSQSAQL